MFNGAVAVRKEQVKSACENYQAHEDIVEEKLEQIYEGSSFLTRWYYDYEDFYYKKGPKVIPKWWLFRVDSKTCSELMSLTLSPEDQMFVNPEQMNFISRYCNKVI